MKTYAEIKSKEYIVCSALNYNGTIVAGLGQYQCIDAVLALKSDADNNIINKFENQGFITSTGRFVNRHEAWDIATANNQIKYNDKDPLLINGKPVLMSIHLYDSDDVFANDQLIQGLKTLNKEIDNYGNNQTK